MVESQSIHDNSGEEQQRRELDKDIKDWILHVMALYKETRKVRVTVVFLLNNHLCLLLSKLLSLDVAHLSVTSFYMKAKYDRWYPNE